MPEQGSTGRSGLTNTEIVSRLLAYPSVLLQVTITDDGYYRYFFGYLHENYSWGVYSRCLCDMLFYAVSCLNIIFISHTPLHRLCTQGPGCLHTAESPLGPWKAHSLHVVFSTGFQRSTGYSALASRARYFLNEDRWQMVPFWVVWCWVSSFPLLFAAKLCNLQVAKLWMKQVGSHLLFSTVKSRNWVHSSHSCSLNTVWSP